MKKLIITENQARQLFKEEDEQENMNNHVKSLIHSGNKENIEIALQMAEWYEGFDIIGYIHEIFGFLLDIPPKNKNIYEKIEYLFNIYTISVPYNNKDIMKIPLGLQYLIQIEVLSLSNTKIEYIPDWIKKLTKIRSLSLANTQIKQIPEAIRDLPDLKKINFKHTVINNIPSFLNNLTNLEFIDISETHIPYHQIIKLMNDLPNTRIYF